MLNQFLLSIVSYSFYLFVKFAEVFNFERKSWRVQVANLHSGARAHSCPSPCQKLEKYFFAIFCAEMLQQFSPTL